MFYYMYKTTNIINGMIYIGVHKSKNEFDSNYYGSGIHIQRALKKYGKEFFKVTVLAYFDSEEEMYLAEEKIITDSFIRSPQNYNMKLGGIGGWPLKGSLEALRIGKIIKNHWKDDNWRANTRENISKAVKEVMNNPIINERVKKGLRNRTEEEKRKQYDNIGIGVKKYHENMTDEERQFFKNRQKEFMSRPEIRKKLSEAQSRAGKGYNNQDFKKRWQPLYDSLKEYIIGCLLDPDIFDSDIVKGIKKDKGQGIKLHKVLKYYEYLGIIKIIEVTKEKDLSTKTKVLKNKTKIEVIDENYS